jgi:hypothetical protein
MHQILDALVETERSQVGLAVFYSLQNLNLEPHRTPSKMHKARLTDRDVSLAAIDKLLADLDKTPSHSWR